MKPSRLVGAYYKNAIEMEQQRIFSKRQLERDWKGKRNGAIVTAQPAPSETADVRFHRKTKPPTEKDANVYREPTAVLLVRILQNFH